MVGWAFQKNGVTILLRHSTFVAVSRLSTVERYFTSTLMVLPSVVRMMLMPRCGAARRAPLVL